MPFSCTFNPFPQVNLVFQRYHYIECWLFLNFCKILSNLVISERILRNSFLPWFQLQRTICLYKLHLVFQWGEIFISSWRNRAFLMRLPCQFSKLRFFKWNWIDDSCKSKYCSLWNRKFLTLSEQEMFKIFTFLLHLSYWQSWNHEQWYSSKIDHLPKNLQTAAPSLLFFWVLAI